MNITIIQKKSVRYHTVCEELTGILDTVPDVKQRFALTGGLCCTDEGEKVLLYDNKASDFCFFCDRTPIEAFLLFIKQFLHKKAIDIDLSYRLLLMADKLDCDEKNYFALFNLLDWPSSRKGLDYLQIFQSLQPALRQKVLEKKLALSEAVLFHNTFGTGYDDFLKQLPVKLTYSELTGALRNIAECQKMYNPGLEAIAGYCKDLDKKAFLEAAHKLRYPVYQGQIEKMEAYIKRLPLVKGTRLLYDRRFEKEQYTLEINFTTLKKLTERLGTLSSHFSGLDEGPDLFDQAELFKDLESGKQALDRLLNCSGKTGDDKARDKK